MDISSLLTNFGQTAHSGQLTQLGQGVNQLVTQKRAERAEAARTAEYNRLLTEWKATGNNSLLIDMQEVYPEKFAGTKSAMDMMGEENAKNVTTTNVKIISAFKMGDLEVAKNIAKDRAIAARASKDESQAVFYDGLVTKFEEGKGQQAIDGLIYSTSATPYGQEALTSLQSINKDEREEVASQGNLFKILQDNPWMSDQDKSDFAKQVDGLNLPIVEMLGRLASIMHYGGDISSVDAINLNNGLRKEYDAYVEPYVTISHSSDQMEAMLLDPSGAVDFGVIRLFNKALDPTSVVRESEAEGTKEATSLLDRLYTKTKNIKEGDLLSPELRADLLAATKILQAGAQFEINAERDRLMKSVEKWPDVFDEEIVFFGSDKYSSEDNKEFLTSKNTILETAKKEGQPKFVIDQINAAESIEDLKGLGDGSLYTEAIGATAETATAETATAETATADNSLAEFLIKKNGYEGAQADLVRRTPETRLRELNPKDSKTWDTTQSKSEDTLATTDTENIPAGAIAKEKASSPKEVETNLSTMRAIFAVVANDQAKGPAMLNFINNASPAELKAQFPELYESFSKRYPGTWATAEAKSTYTPTKTGEEL